MLSHTQEVPLIWMGEMVLDFEYTLGACHLPSLKRKKSERKKRERKVKNISMKSDLMDVSN